MIASTDLRVLAIATDTELARLYRKRSGLRADLDSLAGRRAFMLDIKTGRHYSQADLAKVETDISAKVFEIATVSKEMEPLEAIYAEHKWTRAFLVVGTGNGHVHRSMNCATCFPTTSFVWLPQYSGTEETLIVEDAGERACTVCYPSAPVSILSRPSRIFSDDERSAQAAREARVAAKTERDAKRAAKAPTKDGRPLVVNEVHVGYDGTVRTYRKEMKTEITAVSEYIHFNDSLRYLKDAREVEGAKIAMSEIVRALATKHGISTIEMGDRLAAKIAAKAKREARS